MTDSLQKYFYSKGKFVKMSINGKSQEKYLIGSNNELFKSLLHKQENLLHRSDMQMISGRLGA